MTEKQLIKTVDRLLWFAVACTVIPLIFFVASPHESVVPRGPFFSSKDFHTPVPQDEWWTRIEKMEAPKPKMWEPNEIINMIDSMEIHYQTMEFEYVGRHFITAYCPEECGWSWSTSSGATCHWSSDWKTPTTCAIDLGYHKYGEVILIGNPKDPNNRKIYITEDTGPGVKGLWVDCFVETMDEVRRWNTRYDSVYKVIYVDNTITVAEIRHLQEGNKYAKLGN